MKPVLHILLICATIFTACSESTLEYQNDPRVYFNPDSRTESDSLIVSFVFNPNANTLEAAIKVSTMGLPANEDRAYRIVQVDEPRDNAMAGTHFDFIDDQPLIKKEEISGLFRLRFKKSDDMKTRNYRLRLKIMDNGIFKPGITKNDTYLVIITDEPTKPVDWTQDFLNPNHVDKDRSDFFDYYFGEYSGNKLRFLIEKLGITNFTFSSRPKKVWTIYEGKAKEALDAYNADSMHEPILDDNGQEINFEGIK